VVDSTSMALDSESVSVLRKERIAMHEAHLATLERLLQCAVVVSWEDLLQPGIGGSIHVKYRFGADGSIDTVALWLSTVRGHWHLVCEYRMTSDQQCSMRFQKPYESAKLTRDLHLIMCNQDAFQPATNHGRDGLLQVGVPTQVETDTAGAAISALHLQVESMTTQARRMILGGTHLPGQQHGDQE